MSEKYVRSSNSFEFVLIQIKSWFLCVIAYNFSLFPMTSLWLNEQFYEKKKSFSPTFLVVCTSVESSLTQFFLCLAFLLNWSTLNTIFLLCIIVLICVKRILMTLVSSIQFFIFCCIVQHFNELVLNCCICII